MPVVNRRNSLKKKKARTVLVYAQVSSGIAVQRRQRKGNPSKSGGTDIILKDGRERTRERVLKTGATDPVTVEMGKGA